MSHAIWTQKGREEIVGALSDSGRRLLTVFLCERMANAFVEEIPLAARSVIVGARREFLEAATTQRMPSAARAGARYAELHGLVGEDMPGWEDYAACLAFGYRVLASGELEAAASVVGRILDYVAAVVEEWDPEADVLSKEPPLMSHERDVLRAAIERVRAANSPLGSTEVQRELDEARKNPVPRFPPAG